MCSKYDIYISVLLYINFSKVYLFSKKKRSACSKCTYFLYELVYRCWIHERSLYIYCWMNKQYFYILRHSAEIFPAKYKENKLWYDNFINLISYVAYEILLLYRKTILCEFNNINDYCEVPYFIPLTGLCQWRVISCWSIWFALHPRYQLR